MDNETIIGKLNSALKLEDWKTHNEYKSISVLVLYFEDSEIDFKNEALQVGGLFAVDFHYAVEYYAIPSDHSHRRLDTKINSFLDDHGDPDHLMIIHYGGHGDPDDDTDAQAKLAVWAA